MEPVTLRTVCILDDKCRNILSSGNHHQAVLESLVLVAAAWYFKYKPATKTLNCVKSKQIFLF